MILCHNYQKDSYNCEICTRGFCHRQSLFRHKHLQHGEVRKFQCENCTKVSFDIDWIFPLANDENAQISPCSNICRTMKIIYSKYQSTEGDNNQILISCLWACMFKKMLSCFWFRPRNQYSADKKLNKKEMFYMNWLLCGNLGQNATKKQNKNLIQTNTQHNYSPRCVVSIENRGE